MSLDPMTRTWLVRLFCLSGLLGSALFLSGDMLMYGNWTSAADFHAYREMAERPVAQLVIGGALGPVASLFSAFGMGVFYLTLKPASKRLASVATALLAVMMLVGASYHAVYACFGFASKVAEQTVREKLLLQIADLRNTISYPMYASGLAGTALVYFLALGKKTLFPHWLLIFLPTTLSMASDVFRNLFMMIPAPLGGIFRGGWINGSFVMFFAIATYVSWRIEWGSEARPQFSGEGAH